MRLMPLVFWAVVVASITCCKARTESSLRVDESPTVSPNLEQLLAAIESDGSALEGTVQADGEALAKSRLELTSDGPGVHDEILKLNGEAEALVAKPELTDAQRKRAESLGENLETLLQLITAGTLGPADTARVSATVDKVNRKLKVPVGWAKFWPVEFVDVLDMVGEAYPGSPALANARAKFNLSEFGMGDNFLKFEKLRSPDYSDPPLTNRLNEVGRIFTGAAKTGNRIGFTVFIEDKKICRMTFFINSEGKDTFEGPHYRGSLPFKAIAGGAPEFLSVTGANLPLAAREMSFELFDMAAIGLKHHARYLKIYTAFGSPVSAFAFQATAQKYCAEY